MQDSPINHGPLGLMHTTEIFGSYMGTVDREVRRDTSCLAMDQSDFGAPDCPHIDYRIQTISSANFS